MYKQNNSQFFTMRQIIKSFRVQQASQAIFSHERPDILDGLIRSKKKKGRKNDYGRSVIFIRHFASLIFR